MQVAIPNFTARQRGLGDKAIPQINIGSGDGRLLARIIAEAPADHPPRVRMVVEGRMEPPRTTRNTFGLIRGTTDEWLVLIAHTDGWFEAAVDNGSGLSALLGLAGHFAARPRQSIRRNLLFVATAGHHDGPAIGTWNIVASHLDILERTVLIINLEHLASVGPVRGTAPQVQYAETPHVLFDTHSHPVLRELLMEAAPRFGVPVYTEYVTDRYQADLFPFSSVGATGVPSLMLLQPSFWYHTSEDSIDKIAPLDLEQVTRLHAYLVDALNGMSVAEIREGWKGHTAVMLPRALNPLGLDLAAMRAAELLR